MRAGSPRVRTISATRNILVVLVLVVLYLVSSPATATVFIYPADEGNSSLQGMVSTAENGDTILLKNGAWQENLVINRSIVLGALDMENPPEIISGDGIAGITLSASGIVVDGITLSGTARYGILIQSENNKIHNSSITGLQRGIGLESAEHNEISNNILVNNSVGIYADRKSQMNKVFLNYFDNPMNVMSQSPDLLWDSTPLQYQYGGKNLTGSLGNFWTDYQGEDANGDGVGDVPFIVQNTGSGVLGNFMIPGNGDNASEQIARNIQYISQNTGPGSPGNQMMSASITDYAPLSKPPLSYTMIRVADMPVTAPAGQPLNNTPCSAGPGSIQNQPPPFPGNLGPLWWIIPIIIVVSAVAGIWYERSWWRKRHGRDDRNEGTQSQSNTVVNTIGYPGHGDAVPEDQRHYASRLPPSLCEK